VRATESAGSQTAYLYAWVNSTNRRIFIGSGTHLFFESDNTQDIGASAANRPRNLYLAGALTAASGTVNGLLTIETPSLAEPSPRLKYVGRATDEWAIGQISSDVYLHIRSYHGTTWANKLVIKDTGETSIYGNLIFATDATHDIGASGATRPRHIYASGNVVSGSDIKSDTDDTDTLGTSAATWKSLYLGSTGFIQMTNSATSRSSGTNSVGRIYIKGQLLVVSYKTSGGTSRWYSLDLNNAADQSWVYSGTEP
jgi:hypothetical protein